MDYDFGIVMDFILHRFDLSSFTNKNIRPLTTQNEEAFMTEYNLIF